MNCTSPYVLMKQEYACGKCHACRIARSREWAVRILCEQSYHDESFFLTLTYDDFNLPDDYGLHKKDLQDFMKRLRKCYKNKIRYYGCGEYGEKEGRPHYHLIMFGVGFSDHEVVKGKMSKGNVLDCWGKGFVFAGTVTVKSARYVTNYIQKAFDGELAKKKYGSREKPFQVLSKGMGKQYCLDNEATLRKNLRMTLQGVQIAIPRYYRKILGIGEAELAEKAIVSDFEKKEVLGSQIRSFADVDLQREIIKQRIQRNENLSKRLNLRKKGNL